MKKIFLLLACGVFALGTSAQRARSSSTTFFSVERSNEPITFGITTGLSFANVSLGYDDEDGTETVSTDSRTSFNLGLTVDIPLVESMYIKTGLLYSSKGFVKETDYRKETVSPAYLEIPLLASYRFDFSDYTQLQFNIGPYFAYGIGGKWKSERIDYNDSDEIDYFDEETGTNRFDAGLQIGAGLTFSDHYYVGIGYQWGLANGASEDGVNLKNRNFMINVAYQF